MDTILNMSPVIPYIVLVAGFILLIKGADFFVDGCSAIATIFRIPPVIIGLTIVSMGTSAPEAAVSITSSVKGANAMAVSNVIGSNMFNLLMVIGICSLIKPTKVAANIIARDYPICIVITILMLFMGINFFTDGLNACPVGRVDGLILLVIFVSYILLLVKDAIKNRTNTSSEETSGKNISIPKNIIFIICGAAGIAVGGDFVVDSASAIATSFNISDTLIGLTIVALGTSLPELVTSIVASSKGQNDLAVGNVVGSNIFNILFVLGSAAAISPVDLGGIANPMFTVYDMIILMIVTIIVYFFILFKKDVSRLEGFLMVSMYAGYMVYIIIR